MFAVIAAAVYLTAACLMAAASAVAAVTNRKGAVPLATASVAWAVLAHAFITAATQGREQ